MINGVTMKILADDYILRALQEDVTSEDVTTNAVMPMPKQGKAQLICKETGIIAGLNIFERVFQLLDKECEFTSFFQDGDVVKKGDILVIVDLDEVRAAGKSLVTPVIFTDGTPVKMLKKDTQVSRGEEDILKF